MKHTLADSLDIVLASLSPELVALVVVPGLRKLARALPPIHRGVFECRLSAGAYQVDLAQCILVANSEPALVAEWIDVVTSTSDGLVHSTWERVCDFCAQWADSSSFLHFGVLDIWLEFDREVPNSSLPAFSLFFNPNGVLPVHEPYVVTEVALGVLLSESLSSLVQPGLRRCFQACTDGAHVCQIGVLLSRQTDALRVCIQGLAPEQIIPFLLQVGWPGLTGELERLVTGLIGSAGHISMVDIDVGARGYPKVGLEFSFDEKQPEDEPRWASFLDHLVESGLCTPGKRDGLLSWPGITELPNSPAAWPVHLIVESPSHLPDRVSAFERRLSHVKIVYKPQRPLEAKGYLWFAHTWLQSQPEEVCIKH